MQEGDKKARAMRTKKMYQTKRLEKRFDMKQFNNSHSPRGFIVPEGEAVVVFRPIPSTMETWRYNPLNWSVAALPNDPEARQECRRHL